jgi:allantoin racemase
MLGESLMKIWYQSTLDFAHHPNYERALAAHFKKVASGGTEVMLRGRDRGVDADLPAADIIQSPIVYHSIVVPAFVRSLISAEQAGCDAFVAASFSEPILTELRSLARIPVVSMSEACFVAASTSAPKIGLVTLNKHIIPFIEKSISLHKWKDRVSGIHLIAGDISETELDGKFSDPGPYLKNLADAAQEAVTHGAQAVIPAEGVLGMMAAQNGMKQVAGVPLIDAIGTPILFAEFMVALERLTGVAQSRVAYPLPSEIARNYIEQTESPRSK